MAEAMDLGVGGAVRPDRRRFLTGVRNTGLADWLGRVFGTVPGDPVPFERALTHGSTANANYERLEFLGDRVLGLVIAEWLWESFPAEPEGQLSKRFNALVTGAVCAEVAREIGVRDHLRLGKQARDDGAIDSDNVLGDVMEALIGAWYRAAGLDAARAFVRRVWGDRVRREAKAPQHPKSALQEWAAAAGRRPPEYSVVDRSGPGHAPRFTVSVAIGSHASAEATGGSKQEAETAAARALLEKVSK
jgi:ribonuclease-3